ncbi:MAG TPA: GTPase ObgE, partial [Trichocoleus sp.]
HIERTRLLLHLVDATAEDSLDNYHTIQQELHAYGRGLDQRPQVLALNKADALLEEEINAIAAELEAASHQPVHRISAVSGAGLDSLLQQVWDTLGAIPSEDEPEGTVEDALEVF